eukprot:gnl/TRDRNA2_/TRDRNA2_81520_c0_seq1.p1 gnl/TRDRNA2_/TRDRNA2_81520_c0~~gnl/TRDRNA2_/TRDRNA2_81520_c0_seq1.p1  ORF type:complete len:158 (+),score=14.32 gnl/TRDRNA2_/TRDRNA2_81520_c0_seq1:75-548(+)
MSTAHVVFVLLLVGSNCAEDGVSCSGCDSASTSDEFSVLQVQPHPTRAKTVDGPATRVKIQAAKKVVAASARNTTMPQKTSKHSKDVQAQFGRVQKHTEHSQRCSHCEACEAVIHITGIHTDDVCINACWAVYNALSSDTSRTYNCVGASTGACECR